jgi:hypothetical protein
MYSSQLFLSYDYTQIYFPLSVLELSFLNGGLLLTVLTVLTVLTNQYLLPLRTDK